MTERRIKPAMIERCLREHAGLSRRAAKTLMAQGLAALEDVLEQDALEQPDADALEQADDGAIAETLRQLAAAWRR